MFEIDLLKIHSLSDTAVSPMQCSDDRTKIQYYTILYNTTTYIIPYKCNANKIKHNTMKYHKMQYKTHIEVCMIFIWFMIIFIVFLPMWNPSLWSLFLSFPCSVLLLGQSGLKHSLCSLHGPAASLLSWLL